MFADLPPRVPVSCVVVCLPELRPYGARERIRREMRRYHHHQLPWCTWGDESGSWRAPFALARYRARNPVSTAAGKYQILDTTWHNVGGRDYPGSHDAAQAPPVVQERRARVLVAVAGLSPWVNC